MSRYLLGWSSRSSVARHSLDRRISEVIASYLIQLKRVADMSLPKTMAAIACLWHPIFREEYNPAIQTNKSGAHGFRNREHFRTLAPFRLREYNLALR